MHFTNILTNTPRILWMRSNKKRVESILAAAFIGAIIYGLPLILATTFNLATISFCVLVSVFYVVKIGKKNLREVPSLKVFLITIVYFTIIFVLPFQSVTRVNMSLQPVLQFGIFQYLYILGITALFDIPDVDYDNKSLKTLPQIFGRRRTIFISMGLIVPLLVYLLNGGYDKIYTLLLVAIHIPFYYFLLQQRRDHYYLSFFGEGILGLLGVYYYLI